MNTRERECKKQSTHNSSLRSIAKQLIPPLVLTILKKILANQFIGFVSFATWEEAKKASEGYDADSVI